MEVVERFWVPLRSKPLDWCDKEVYLSNVPSLPLARNMLAESFLESDCTHALWVDGDHLYEREDGEIGDPNEALWLLYRALEESGEHIACALYRAKQKHGFNYAIWRESEECRRGGDYSYVHVDRWEGNWFEVDVAGMGMVLMTREVLERIKAANKIYKGQFFSWEDVGGQSEDFNFFQKARAVGFKVWCFSKVRLIHEAHVFMNSEGKIRVPRV